MSAWPALGELVPHAGAMLLLDRVLAYAPDSICAEAVITRDHAFFQVGKGVPAYVGLEMMAQTVCVWDGLRRRHNGQAPAIGFLLGTRRYTTARPFFREAERLRVEAVSLLNDGSVGSFECRIFGEGLEELAKGVINVYRPKQDNVQIVGSAGAVR